MVWPPVTIRDTRLVRLSGGLTAQQRALLVLRSWKEGREEEPSWRWSMPEDQLPEFNRLIELMNGVNVRLVPYLVVVHLEADKLDLRLAVLATLTLWALQAAEVDMFVKYGCKKRDSYVLSLAQTLEHAPLRPVPYLSEEDLSKLNLAEPTKIDEVTELQRGYLRRNVRELGCQLRAAELAVADVQAAFDGEDPALPDVREKLDRAAERLVGLREGAERYTGPLEVSEPDEELVDKVWRLVEGA